MPTEESAHELMNHLALIHFAAFVSLMTMGVYVFTASKNTGHSRIFLVICVLLSLHTLVEFGYAHSPTQEFAHFLNRLNFWWLLPVGASLHFTTVLHAGIDHGTGLVHTPTHLGNDPVDDLDQVVITEGGE